MAKELVAMLLAGGQGSRLYALITETCKAGSSVWRQIQDY